MAIVAETVIPIPVKMTVLVMSGELAGTEQPDKFGHTLQ
tara:strand:+ start:189 stop:305 length:117 start_codon:yes stop_codon:yes gene_type:complete